MDNKSVISVLSGTVALATSSAITQETLNIVLTILSVISIILSMVLSLIKWYNDSKKDGKITSDEIAKGVEIIKDGTDKVKEVVKDDKQSGN